MTIASRALVAIAVLVTSGRAYAQTAEAEVLFREGKRLMKAGEIERACEKFEASERMEAENGTELNLADCWEQIGRTASAWAMFEKAAASAKREDRAAEARRRAAALKANLVHLTIEVPSEAELDDLSISRNDQSVDRELWNQAVPVDPGEHTITASAPGREDWSTNIKVKTKDKVIAVPPLERATTKKKKKRSTDEPTAPNPYRTLSLGLGIGGVAAVAIATGFALHSKSLQDDSDAICPTTSCGDLGAVDLNHRARTEGWVANIGWGLGGVAIAAAVVTWTVGARKADRAVAITPIVGSDGAGLAVGGWFP